MLLELLANFLMYLSILAVITSVLSAVGKYAGRPSYVRDAGITALETPVSKPDTKWIKKLGACFAANRIFLFMVVYLLFQASQKSSLGFFESFRSIWLKWDSNGYLRIAENWYATTGDEKYDIALYPLYPLLVKVANFVINNYFLSGLFISNIMLLIGSYFLYKLVRLEFGADKPAFDSVKYVLIFPFSFFFSIVYTESLFFALTVLTIYFVRRNFRLLGGIFGLLAAFSRNQGLVLILPVFVELASNIDWKQHISSRNIKVLGKDLLQITGVTLLIPCGTFLYLLVNKLTYGNWFQFLFFQNENWSQRFGFFASNIRNFVFEAAHRGTGLSMGVFIPNIIIFFMSLLLLTLCIKKLRLSYIIYTLAYLLISFSPTWLLSGPRYISGMFTLYIMLALLIRRNLSRRLMEIILFVLLIAFSVLFASGNVF